MSSSRQQGSTPAAVAVFPDEVDFDAYSDRELLRLRQEFGRKIDFLGIENKLFDSYLHRVLALPRDEAPGTADGKDDKTALISSTAGFGSDAVKRKNKTNNFNATNAHMILLSPDQKAEIATRELEELRDEIEKEKDEWARVIDNLKAELEELDIRLNEAKKAVYEFKRDIVGSAVNARTGKILAERLVRYCEEKIKMKDALIEKIRLKNSTLKNHRNKLYLQLKQKEEMGEVLHAIDFDQLQIENKQYLAKIEERNNELLKLKMTVSKTVQILNYYKRKLSGESTLSQNLSEDITQRRESLGKLGTETSTVEYEKDKAENSHTKLKDMISEVRVPSVMSYVQLKAQQTELNKTLKSWERKCEISGMQLQRTRTIHRQVARHEEKAQELGLATVQIGDLLLN